MFPFTYANYKTIYDFEKKTLKNHQKNGIFSSLIGLDIIFDKYILSKVKSLTQN